LFASTEKAATVLRPDVPSRQSAFVAFDVLALEAATFERNVGHSARGPTPAAGSTAACGVRDAFMEDEATRLSHVHGGCGDETRRREPADLQRLLLDVSRLAASRRDLADLVGDLVVVLQRAVPLDGLAVVLYDRNKMVLYSASGTTFPPKDIAVRPEADPSEVAWLTQQPIFVPDVEREPRFPEIVELACSDGTRSFCVFPLTSPVRRLGALAFKSRETDAFHDVDREFLQQLTDEVALAVDNALHQQRAKQEHDRLGMLLEINNTLVSNLDPQALFEDIAACLRRVVAHDLTGLLIYDAERNGFHVAALAFENKEIVRKGEFFGLDDKGNPAGAAFRAGTPLRIGRDVIATLGAGSRPVLAEVGIESACLLPMSARGRRVGTIVVGRRRSEPFSDDDVAILAGAAGQIAFAVANALAFEEIDALNKKLALEKVYLEDELRTHYDFEEIVGESPALKAVLAQVETVGATSSTVLIRGETGTGKELIARAIHERSPRKARTLVKMNCAAIPTGLLESELFGHERGAFTGAIAQKIGRFELADGGTLFLDEVGDIPLELQPKLLRVLQEQEFERLGSTRTKHADVRIVAATHRSLEEMVAAGAFRRDLYYRLNVFPIVLPALRERREDIPPLVRYFVQKFARGMNKVIATVPSEAMRVLAAYDWPGNVRELENAIERAVILTNGSVLQVLLAEFRTRSDAPTADGTLEATEREAILKALRESHWVIGGPAGAARRLGLKRTTLHSRMEKLGIARPKP
jgi:formate hydrogenlyase transcriptional activator